MRFQVPQFIEIEDKIFGPLTLKQFLYLAGGAGMGMVLFRFLGKFGIIIAIPVVLFGVALAFYKINNKPFVYIVEAAITYFIHSKLYLWKKSSKPIERSRGTDPSGESLLYIPKLSEDKLDDMAWNIGTGEKVKTSAKGIVREAMEEKARRNTGS